MSSSASVKVLTLAADKYSQTNASLNAAACFSDTCGKSTTEQIGLKPASLARTVKQSRALHVRVSFPGARVYCGREAGIGVDSATELDATVPRVQLTYIDLPSISKGNVAA
jgi:hypothetical protein